MKYVWNKVQILLVIFTLGSSCASDFDNVSDSFCLSCRSRSDSNGQARMEMGRLQSDIAKTDDNKHNKVQNEGKNNTIESNLDSQSQNSSNLFNNYILAQFQEQNNPQEYDDLNSSQDLNIHQDCNIFDADNVKINLLSGNSCEGKIENLKNDKLLCRKGGEGTKVGKNMPLSKTKINNTIHDKYRKDIYIRKVKVIVLEALLKFINKKIEKVYNSRTSNKKKIVKISSHCYADDKKDHIFIHKSLMEIFSGETSGLLKNNYGLNHNRNLINELIKIETPVGEIIKKLFSLTFIECLNHFTGEHPNTLLDGMGTVKKYKSRILKGIKGNIERKACFEHFCYVAENFEKIIEGIKRRPNRESRKNNKRLGTIGSNAENSNNIQVKNMSKPSRVIK